MTNDAQSLHQAKIMLETQAARIERLEAEAKTRTLDYLGQVGQLSEELERLRAALREIDQQRYTDRCTISTTNAYEVAIALNDTLLAVMNIARAALGEK